MPSNKLSQFAHLTARNRVINVLPRGRTEKVHKIQYLGREEKVGRLSERRNIPWSFLMVYGRWRSVHWVEY